MDKSILRSYDIRGVYPSFVNEEVAFKVGISYGNYLKEKEYKTVVVGCDIRLSSGALKESVIKGIISSGLDAIDIGECTTPMCSFATIKYHTGAIMVTASHNPKDENGFKFFLKDNLSLAGDDLKVFYKLLDKEFDNDKKGKITKANVFPNYKKAVLNDLKFGKRIPKVVVDCGNGAASLIVKKIFNTLPVEIKYICNKPDGNFPLHHPDPSVEDNMAMLKEAVIKNGADFGVAYDGDADRIGMVDEKGNFLSADKIMIIFLHHLNINKTLYDVKCSLALKKEIQKLGIKGICFKTGAVNTKNEINKQKLLFGGEYSGHLVFNDKYLGIDDGIYASIRLMEIFSKSKGKVSKEFKNVETFVSTGEIKIPVNDDDKLYIVEGVLSRALKKGYLVKTIDGIRIEGRNYMVCLRASNTGPNLTFIVEAKNENLLNEKKEEFIKYINLFKK